MAAAFPPSTSAAAVAGAWPRAQVRAAGRGPDVPLRCGPALRPRPAFPSGAGGPRRRHCFSRPGPRWWPLEGWAAVWSPSGLRWPSTRWAWRCFWPACSLTSSSPTCSSTRAASASSSASSGGYSGTPAIWRCRRRSCATTWVWRWPRVAGTACCGGWCTASASASPPPSLPHRDPAPPPTWSCSSRGAAPLIPAGSVEDMTIEDTASKRWGSAANYGKRIPYSMQ